MKFLWTKTENCFSDSQTYEYRLPINGEAFCALLDGWELRQNRRLRRPVFMADKDGVNLKGVLSYYTVRASFPTERWEAEKEAFEAWLGGCDV